MTRYNSINSGIATVTYAPFKEQPRSHKTAVVNTYGILLMVVLVFIAYMSFNQPVPTERPTEQAVLYTQVPTATPGPPPSATGVDKGEAFAYIRIPRFGKTWVWTVLEGTSMDILNSGPGRFQRSALPGEVGNTAIAAHRAGHGDPFIDFEELRLGDEVTLAQNGAEWKYKITVKPTRIQPNESWVADNTPTGKMLTLVTCWPKYGSSERIYIRAELQEVS